MQERARDGGGGEGESGCRREGGREGVKVRAGEREGGVKVSGCRREGGGGR